MTDWYVTLPYATGMVTVHKGRVVSTPPIFRWMIGMQWIDCKATIASKGGHGEPLPPPEDTHGDRADRGAEH